MGARWQRSSDIALTASVNGPSVGLTWIRSRSQAVKWIRQTMVSSLAYQPKTGQYPGQVPARGLPAGPQGRARRDRAANGRRPRWLVRRSGCFRPRWPRSSPASGGTSPATSRSRRCRLARATRSRSRPAASTPIPTTPAPEPPTAPATSTPPPAAAPCPPKVTPSQSHPPQAPHRALAEQGAVGVQGRLPAQVRVQDGGVLADPAGANQVDEGGHGLALVDRVDDHPFQPSGQPDRVQRGLHRDAVVVPGPAL